MQLTRLPHEILLPKGREWEYGVPKSDLEPLVDFWYVRYLAWLGRLRNPIHRLMCCSACARCPLSEFSALHSRLPWSNNLRGYIAGVRCFKPELYLKARLALRRSSRLIAISFALLFHSLEVLWEGSALSHFTCRVSISSSLLNGTLSVLSAK